MATPVELKVMHVINGQEIETWVKAEVVRINTPTEFLVRKADGVVVVVRDAAMIRPQK